MSSTPTIKPIETVYNGYRFRSRLEARWAVFFDTLGIAYEYEKEGYDLGEAGWYLPDFWLPKLKWWIEIKPQDAIEGVWEKPHSLAWSGQQNVAVLCGVPGCTHETSNGFDLTSPTYRGTAFIGNHNQLTEGLISMGHGPPEFESLHEFLLEKNGVLSFWHDVPDYDETEKSARRLIELDQQYYFQKYGRKHPNWEWDNFQDHVAWAISPIGDFFLELPYGWVCNPVEDACIAARQARFERC